MDSIIARILVALVGTTTLSFAHGGEVHRATGLPTIGVAVSFDPSAGKGATVTGTLTLTVPKGWHIYAKGAPEEFVAASVTPTDDIVDQWHVAWPTPTRVTFEGIEIPVYEGKTHVPLEGRLAVDPPATWRGVVTFQGCGAELCLPPETREITATLR